MKFKISNLLPAIPVGIVLGMMMISYSCANTTTPPTGGPKDTIPPIIKKVVPEQGAVNVPRHKTEITFTFNEYVVVKEGKNIYLSPPLEKAPKYKIKGKSVVVTFEGDLDSNKTYVLDITGAIVDNNEGNPFPGYSLVFSTGDHIDSMMVTGTVQDCNTLKPLKGATVMLYKDQADSAIFLHRPDAAIKTDDWGFFCLRNIQDTVYRMYAIMDDNGNNKYDPESDKVGFIDSLVRPVTVVNDSLPELEKLEMTDTVCCLARKSEYEINVFKEKPSKQMIVNKVRVGERTSYITFMAPNAQVDTLWMSGVKKGKLITQFNLQKDSLEIWVNDPRKQPDTLYLNVKYMKTDSLGKLKQTLEQVKLPKTKEMLAAAQKSSKKDIKKEDTTCVFTVDAKPENIEQYGFVIEFKYPIIEDGFDDILFHYKNPKQQDIKGKFKLERDSLNLRKYIVRPEGQLQQGYEYFLKIPHRKFKDINGFYNDSTEVKVTLPNDDKLSTLILNVQGVRTKYIVDLLTEKRDAVVRSFIINSDQALTFPYVKAGKYYIRITEDRNNNNLVDTGVLLERKQPEKVLFYKLQSGESLINIPEMAEIEQTVDIQELFR